MALKEQLDLWLSARKMPFLEQLDKIEMQNNKALQEIASTDQDYKYEPKLICDGSNMCQISSAALAEGLKGGFGKKVKVEGVVREVPNLPTSHNIIRVSEGEKGQKIAVDATFRQIRKKARPNILVFPRRNEGRLYGGGFPTSTESGTELSERVRNLIKDGKFPGVTTSSYEELVKTLKK